MSTDPRTPTPAEDDADRHVARWRNHWIDVEFDDTVEAIAARIGTIIRYLRDDKQRSVRAAGLQGFEYDTLHSLMIRDTPGTASPSELATDSDVSPAGMTGRLDTLERAGYIRRRTVEGDRRRVEVEATAKGIRIWRKAMALRGNTEEELIGVLEEPEREQLSSLLRKLTLAIESEPEPNDEPAQ